MANSSPKRKPWQFSLSQLLAWVTLAAAMCCIVALVREELLVLLAVIFYFFILLPIILLVHAWPLLLFVGLIFALQVLCFFAVRRRQ